MMETKKTIKSNSAHLLRRAKRINRKAKKMGQSSSMETKAERLVKSAITSYSVAS